jgi:peroxiredoxin Q/BCP
MKLKEKQFAPDFTTTDIFGNTFQLSELRGKKIVLGFYRNVACPFCNRRVHQLMLNSVKLKNSDTALVFLFESSNEKLKKSAFHKGVAPWPLIGDPQQEVYKKYGVGSSIMKMMRTLVSADVMGGMKNAKENGYPDEKDNDASMAMIPADFFINENFVIERAHYGKHMDDHVPLDDLLSFAGVR